MYYFTSLVESYVKVRLAVIGDMIPGGRHLGINPKRQLPDMYLVMRAHAIRGKNTASRTCRPEVL